MVLPGGSSSAFNGRSEALGAREYIRNQRRGGGGGSSRPAPSPTVRVDGNTVVIDGQGFSVAPALQAEFIRNRTGGSGASAQEAIKIAQENFERMERQRVAQQQAQAEKLRIEQLKRAVAMRDMSVLQRQKLTQEINRRTQNLIQQGRVIGSNIKSGVTFGYDFISGGSVSEGRILNKQDKLNKEIENFNIQYGSQELSDSEYAKAQKIEKKLANKQKQIDSEYNKLAQSKRSKIYGFLNPLDKRVTLAQGKTYQDKLISKTEKELSSMKNELKNTNSKYKKTILPRLIKSTERELLRYQAGGKPIILTGDLPIIPLKTIPTKIISVKFLGTQRTLKDGRILVDISYKTSAGRVGKAQGFVKQVGDKKSIGIVRGKSGVKYYKTPTKFKIRKVESFRGVERSLSSPGVIKLKNNLGGVTTVKKGNIINQLSAGRVVSKVRGRPFVKSIGQFKIKPKLDIQDFVSLSKSLTVKDLSFVAGQSITSQQAKAKFVGLIRNLDKAGTTTVKFKPSEGRQISTAITKLVNSMLGSISASQKASPTLSTANKVSMASNLLRNVVNNPKVFTPAVLKSPKLVEQKLLQKILPKAIQTSQTLAPRQRIKARSLQNTLDRQDKKVKQLIKQKTKTRSKTKQRDLQIQLNKIKQQQRSRLKQLQKMKQVQKLQMARLRMTITTRTVPRKIGFFALKIPKGFTSKTLSKSIVGYYVVEKKNNKLVKLFPKPLSKNSARDYLAYSIDNKLTRSGWLVPIGKTKKIVVPGKNIQGYFSRTSKKYRPYRIKFGRKKMLVDGYIEKLRYFQDRVGEKQQLRTARKISPSQRKELLQRLARARAIRMRNLRRRK